MMEEGAGDQLFAGAALADNQHRHVTRRHPADRLVHRMHGGTAADNVLGVRRGILIAEDRWDVTESAQLQCPLDDLAQLVEVHGLEEILEGATFHRLDGRVRGSVCSDNDHGQPCVDFANSVKNVHAGHVGEAHVQDRRVGSEVPCQLDALPARSGGGNLQLEGLQSLLDRIEDVGLVINHE